MSDNSSNAPSLPANEYIYIYTYILRQLLFCFVLQLIKTGEYLVIRSLGYIIYSTAYIFAINVYSIQTTDSSSSLLSGWA